jgi:hypothetical protein
MSKKKMSKQRNRSPTLKVNNPLQTQNEDSLTLVEDQPEASAEASSPVNASTSDNEIESLSSRNTKPTRAKVKTDISSKKENAHNSKPIPSNRWAWGWEAVVAISTVIGTVFAITASYVAYQTFESTVDTAQKQLRAYVGVDDIGIELPSSKVENYQPVKLSLGTHIPDYLILTVKNTGTTPAKKVTTWVNWEPLPFGYQLPEDFDFKDHESTFKGPLGLVKSTYSLFPGQPRETIISIADARSFLEAQSKKKSLYLYGYISYEDIYGREHKTNFCYAYQPYANASQQFLPCTIHQEVF